MGLPDHGAAPHARASSPAASASASASPGRWPREPELLVCDEADQRPGRLRAGAGAATCCASIQDDTGITYVFISHNLGVVREISDTVIVMQRRQVVERGSTADVLTAPERALHPASCAAPPWTPRR